MAVVGVSLGEKVSVGGYLFRGNGDELKERTSGVLGLQERLSFL